MVHVRKFLGPEVLVHTGSDMAATFAEDYRARLAEPGVTWGVPSVDKVVIPARAGMAVGLIGRPGHAKSTMLAAIGKHHCRRLMEEREQGGDHNKVVVYVSWEQGIEEVETYLRPDTTYTASDYHWGRVPEEYMVKSLKNRADFPLWAIGMSRRVMNMARRQEKRVPRMTLPVVLEAIETMEYQWGVRPDLLLFDYVQLIPVEGTRSRQEQVMEAAPEIKMLAQRVRCPAFVGVQASRDVDERKWKVPQARDCQWSSQIEQAFDALFGLWRPIRTEAPDAEPLPIQRMINGRAVTRYAQITPNLLIMQMLKQRGDIGAYTWALHLAPQWLRLTEMETDWGHEPAAAPAYAGEEGSD